MLYSVYNQDKDPNKTDAASSQGTSGASVGKQSPASSPLTGSFGYVPPSTKTKQGGGAGEPAGAVPVSTKKTDKKVAACSQDSADNVSIGK